MASSGVLWVFVSFVLFLPGNTIHHGPWGSRGLAPWYETGRTPERRGKKTVNKEMDAHASHRRRYLPPGSDPGRRDLASVVRPEAELANRRVGPPGHRPLPGYQILPCVALLVGTRIRAQILVGMNCVGTDGSLQISFRLVLRPFLSGTI